VEESVEELVEEEELELELELQLSPIRKSLGFPRGTPGGFKHIETAGIARPKIVLLEAGTSATGIIRNPVDCPVLPEHGVITTCLIEESSLYG